MRSYYNFFFYKIRSFHMLKSLRVTNFPPLNLKYVAKVDRKDTRLKKMGN